MGVQAIESLPSGSAIVHVGPGSFVMPWLEFRATPFQVARIQIAAMLGAANDRAGVVCQLLAEVEAEMAKEARRREKTPPEGRAINVPADLDARDGPVALRSGKELGLGALVSADGRRYLPDPYRQKDSRPHPALDKFDRVAAVQPPPMPLDIATMSEEQSSLLERADKALVSANRRRDARTKTDRFTGEILGYGRITQAERDERRFARDAYASLGLGTLATKDRDEVKRGRAESFALAEARARAERRAACVALLAYLKRPRLVASPRATIAKEMCELRTAMFDEARAAVLQDVKAGGRRLTRDGLDCLDLTPIQRASAEWFRGVYQRTERGARVANMEGRVGGGREDNRTAKEWGADQITRKEIEAKVMAIKTGNGRAITTLRLVAGEGRNLRSISTGGAGRALDARAFREALDVVADHRGLQ